MNEKKLKSNDSQNEEIKKNERFAYILGIFTQLLWAINGLQLKSIQLNYKESYSMNSIIFWRCLPVVIISYLTCYYQKIKITPHKEIKHLIWFYFRSLGNYFFVLINIKVFSYFRLSTSRVFLSCQPIIVVILSIIFLSEKFYIRYLVGILICLFGSALITLNDNKPQSKNTISNDNIYEGLFFAILLLIIGAMSSVGQKMITKDGMPVPVQNFYLGIYNGGPGLIMCILERHFALNDLNYIIYCTSNGLVFYFAHYLTSICYKYIDISKFSPITYLVVVYTFLLSVIVLNEALFFTDVLGAALIIGFQFYNLVVTPQKEANNENIREKFLEEINKNDKSDINIIKRISIDSI